MYIHSHNLYFIHETETSKNIPSPAAGWVTCLSGLLSSNSPSASAAPSLWWLSEHVDAGAFDGVQVVRGVGYICEQRAMWKLCLRFHLLLKLNVTSRQVVRYCTLCWRFELLRWAVADNQQTQLSWHSKHAFSAWLTILPLPQCLVFFFLIVS